MRPKLKRVSMSKGVIVPLYTEGVKCLLGNIFNTPAADTSTSKGVCARMFGLARRRPSFAVRGKFGSVNGCAICANYGVDGLRFGTRMKGGRAAIRTSLVTTSRAVRDTAVGTGTGVRPIFHFSGVGTAVGRNNGVLNANEGVDLSVSYKLSKSACYLGNGSAHPTVGRNIVNLSNSLAALFANLSLLGLTVGKARADLRLLFGTKGFSLSLLLPRIRLRQGSPRVDNSGNVALSARFRTFFSSSARGSTVITALVGSITSCW